ncbi:MAG TPA: DUF4833 domain-containing protein [Candidatus Edwardsbacteria bacterium]|nr:DUF4833 domain-containing protein [Candidatus Edwardsbacteria bacterium]
MRTILILTIIHLLGGQAIPPQTNRLFTISKNTNGNYVCFDARRNCDANNPHGLICCYWHQAGSGATKPLNVLERLAYGYTITPDTSGCYRISFHRFPRQVIWLVNWNGSYRAMTSVAEHMIWLDDIHLVFQNCSVNRPVTRIELRGRDTGDGGEAVLTIDPARERPEHPPACRTAN